MNGKKKRLDWHNLEDDIIKEVVYGIGLMQGISPDYIHVEGLLGGELLANKEASP